MVGIGSLVEEYLKPHDEQFCFTKLCFYENYFGKCNHMPNWNKIQEGEGLNDKWPQQTLYRNALAETETQI